MAMSAPDIASGRLAADDYARNFSDIHPPLGRHQALVEADRCYFCYDAPCVKACPTTIDIPLFIRQILTDNPLGSAETILSQNILGGMCARVCPTETLCEEACVREEAEGKPVKIGLLQRYATDYLMEEKGEQPFQRAAPTGKRVAVVGAGPAGLACAHRLAMHGHDVVIYEAREKAGGLNEYGIAAYKTPDDFAQAEVDFVLSIGGITIEYGKKLGHDVTLDELKRFHDAVFLGIGLSGVNGLGLADDNLPGIEDAVDYIAELRQAEDLGTLPVGSRVVVIGGGMTAIDIAVQSKRLGAKEVTLVYRRPRDKMKASGYEQELALTNDVVIRDSARPTRLITAEGRVTGVEFETTMEEAGKLVGTGEMFEIAADMVFKAIGQRLITAPLHDHAIRFRYQHGTVDIDDECRTSMPGVWAGGDCSAAGDGLTVEAVADGRIAAESIHRALIAG
jgi:glutamate synthase (NADPH/NADH) small chain